MVVLRGEYIEGSHGWVSKYVRIGDFWRKILERTEHYEVRPMYEDGAIGDPIPECSFMRSLHSAQEVARRTGGVIVKVTSEREIINVEEALGKVEEVRYEVEYEVKS